MLYRQDVAGVMATTIGRKGALDSGMEAALKRADRALVTLRRWHVEGHMPLLQLPSRRDDLAACRTASDRLLKGAKDVVLLGTGGSSLGAQALAQFAGWGCRGCRRSVRAPRKSASTSSTISTRSPCRTPSGS